MRRGPVTRNDFTLAEIRAIHDLPIPDLIWRAQPVHREHHPAGEVQLCSLLSVKTGGCPEDCAVLHAVVALRHRPREAAHDEAGRGARRRRAAPGRPARPASAWARPGARSRTAPRSTRCSRWCAASRRWAWRRAARSACSTEAQAHRLADAGLTAYNHNLDTSRSFYKSIITTRTYDDRLRTIENVRKAGITVCSGGIIGMGESLDDRCAMLMTLANLDPQPESVPVNALATMPDGVRTPLSDRPPDRSVRAGAHDRDRAHPDAEGARAAVGGARRAVARGADALFPGRRQLGLLRREAADHRQPRRRRRPRAAARRRPATVAVGIVAVPPSSQEPA